MSKKGFTLVELLACLVVLGVITLVSVPTVINTNRQQKEKQIIEYKNTVLNAAEIYVETHLQVQDVANLKNGSAGLNITGGDLISAGLISSSLINPNGDVSFSTYKDEIKVFAQKSGTQIIYTYQGD